MKKMLLLFVFSVLFISGALAQSCGDIFKYMNKVDDNGYIRAQRSYLTQIATIKSSSRARYARYLSNNAAEVKSLYSKAYDRPLAYESKMRDKKGYSELASKLNSLKSSLRLLIRYSNTMKVYSARIVNNYKSVNNRDYYYEIQNAFNSVVRAKKNSKRKTI